MAGFSKLFSSIVTSSIWCEDHVVLRVWIAMLATCDASGVVEGSTPGYANLCRVSREDMLRAIQILSSPDPDSRTPDNEGRRIEVIQGGWRILNYGAYRERCQAKDGSRAEYMRGFRARKKHDVTRNSGALRVAAPASASASPYQETEGNVVTRTPRVREGDQATPFDDEGGA